MKGSRQWFWAKDVHATNRLTQPGPEDVLYLCDVDYYVDIPRLLTQHYNPVLCYTVVPETAACATTSDTSFKFLEDGILETRISGGGLYQHPIWDYGRDSTMVSSYVLGFIPWTTTVYAVERKQVAKHRQLILMAPIKRFNHLGACLANWLLEAPILQRFNPVLTATTGEKYVRINVQRSDGLYVSTARADSYACATVPVHIDDSVAAAARLYSTKLMIPSTSSWIGEDRTAAAVLTEFHRLFTAVKVKAYVFPVTKAVRNYQFRPENYDQEARPKLQAFMSPLLHGAFAPDNIVSSEERCVEGRVNALKKDEPKPCRFRDRCMDEFAELVLTGMTLEPVCYEVIENKQSTVPQKQSLRRACVTGYFRQRILKCFIKAEAYQDVKDPRNISTYNDADKLDMSGFTLALSEHLKQFPWYGPGMTPLEIANRVVDICLDAQFVNVSDYHRMDGTVSETLRMVDRMVCMKAFTNHRTVLNELLKRNYDNFGVLPYGTKFDQGPSHGSGCPGTSVFQTLRAAFTAYLGFRRQLTTKNPASKPEHAFKCLGIHLGDDGLDADLSIKAHSWAANRVGLVLEAAVVERGCRGVTFLARYYSPDVWNGLPDSMCDVKRQLSKFHTTVRLPHTVTAEQKLAEKARSYVLTDGNTPVIGEFCRRAVDLCPLPKHVVGVGHWWSKFNATVQFPNQNVGDWMDHEFDHLLPEFDRELFVRWLSTCQTPTELLRPPLCAEIKAPSSNHPVVVDDDVLCPTPTSTEFSFSSVQSERSEDVRTPEPASPLRITITGDTTPRQNRGPRRKKPPSAPKVGRLPGNAPLRITVEPKKRIRRPRSD